MNDCTRFEEEGLLALEQGRTLDEHFSTCAVCIEEQRKYAALKEKLSASGDAISPPPDWEQNVFDQVRVKPTVSRGYNKKRWFGALAAGIATIAIASMMFLQLPNQSITKGLDQLIVASDRTYRGEDAKVGDALKVLGRKDDFKHTQIHIYRNSRHYFSCGAENPCDFDEDIDTFIAQVELRAVGQYQVVLIRSNQTIEVASENLDQSVLQARELAAQVILGEPISVR